MKFLVGLGNLGARYEFNRHNVGFQILDGIAASLKAGPWTSQNKGLTATVELDGEKLLLIKPQTYMNLSGECVGVLARFYKVLPEDTFVFYDELDLKPHQIRIKQGGGSGGHNGIKSLDAHLETPEYWRIRYGIGHPRALDLQIGVEHYVLQNFSKDDQKLLEDTKIGILQALPLILSRQHEKALNLIYNKGKTK